MQKMHIVQDERLKQISGGITATREGVKTVLITVGGVLTVLGEYLLHQGTKVSMPVND